MSKTTRKPASTAVPEAASPAPLAAAFKPFEWICDGDVASNIPASGAVAAVGRAMDIANGLAVVLRMLEQAALDTYSCDENGDDLPPLLDSVSASRLFRFGIAAADLLAEDMEAYQEFLRKHHPGEGGAK